MRGGWWWGRRRSLRPQSRHDLGLALLPTQVGSQSSTFAQAFVASMYSRGRNLRTMSETLRRVPAGSAAEGTFSCACKA